MTERDQQVFIDRALNYHKKGFNCAQAVACALAPLWNADETLLFRLTEGFGLGMGCTDGVCGALSAAILISGLAVSDGNTDRPASKRATYALSGVILDSFRKDAGEIHCRAIKGIDTGSPLTSCNDCIRIGVLSALQTLKP